MMQAVRRALSLGLLVLLTGCQFGGGEAAARTRGAKEAADAIAAGRLVWKDYPPPPAPAWLGEYIKLLREKDIGYEAPSLPQGVPEADFVQEVRGWNEVMTAEIERRFGAGILGRLREEATKRWEDRVKSKG